MSEELETSDTSPVAEVSSGMDMESAVDQIGDRLFGADEHEETDEPDAPLESVSSDPVASPSVAVPEYAIPKTWPTDMHEHWGKMPKEAQKYWETREGQMLNGLQQYKETAQYGQSLRDILTPYKPILAAAGMDDNRAIATLLNAHYRLTQGSPEDRRTAYDDLGRNLGFLQAQQQNPVDPAYAALQQQIAQLTNKMTSREAADHQANVAAYEERRTSVQSDVEKFAADTSAHPHFDAVADDIIAQIQAGHSLQDAYDRAVFSNPVTREKEFARRQTADAKAREVNGRQSALVAQKASSVNMKSRDGRREPTEPVGDMRDTLASTLASIRARSS